MKTLLNVAIASVLGASLFTGTVSAIGSTCTISETGPDSVNTCAVGDTVIVVCENKNEVEIGNWAEQDAETGNADNNGNTTGGGATTGDATNINENNVSVVIENACNEDKDTTPETPAPTTNKPEKPGMGAGPSAAPEVPAEQISFTALPETSATSPAVYAGVITAIVGAGALAARLSAAAYARFRA